LAVFVQQGRSFRSGVPLGCSKKLDRPTKDEYTETDFSENKFSKIKFSKIKSAAQRVK